MPLEDTRPKGKCDMCRKKPAAYWFGQTSVALCGDEDCERRNQSQWEKMLEDMQWEEDNGY
jgi:hypothetical protein